MSPTNTPSDLGSKPVNWRDLPEFQDHEYLVALSDESSGLKAYIGIHNTNRGPALGGTRFKLYDSEEQAMRDVLNLSKAMSYKCALANLPYGGGKGVIIADPQADRDAQLAAYAKRVEKLGGLFKTGTDVGISDGDVRHMAQYTSHMLGVTEAERGILTTSNVAALGVFYAMKAVLAHLYGSESFEGRSVAIKGTGKLGGELASLVTKSGGSVFVSDVDEAKTQALKEEIPAITVVDNDSINRQEVDIYAPCALGNEFDEETIPQLRCKAVTGGANNQLAGDSAGDLLHEHGILYAPDYIANAGGLIYVADELEPDGFNQQRVIERTQHIQATIADILSRSKDQNLPTYKVADMIAEERINGASHDQ